MIYQTIFAFSAAILPMVVSYFIKHRYRSKLKNLQFKNWELDNSYYHCMFWTMDNINCRTHMYKNVACGDKCSVTQLGTLINFLSSATVSIAMCMYYITLTQVTDELIKAQRRGVHVRIITDLTTFNMNHSKVKLLKKKYGFEVRAPPYKDSFMHHKYCVVDGGVANLQKMFLGSLNLTLQGCVANFEFVVITNNSHITNQYNEEFEMLWKSFDIPKVTSDVNKVKIY